MTTKHAFAWATESGHFHRSKRPIATINDLQRAVAHRSSYNDACYATVYGFTDFDNKYTCVVNKIYIDMDNEANPQLAMGDATKIAHRFSGSTTQYFSGLKGIGQMIHCNTVDLIPEMKSVVLRRWTHNVIDELDIKTADSAVIGDLNRVHRIIDTRHRKSGLYAIGLLPNELSLSIDEVKRMAVRPRGLEQEYTPSSEVSEQLLAIEDELLVERLQRFVDIKMIPQSTFDATIGYLHGSMRRTLFEFIVSLDDEHRYNVTQSTRCVERENTWVGRLERRLLVDGQLTNGRDRGVEHKQRVHFCKSAHENGYSFGEICDAFVNLVDRNGRRCYDKQMTEQQVKSCIAR